jgi:hypothetical protein
MKQSKNKTDEARNAGCRYSDVNDTFNKLAKKNEFELKNALIEPIHQKFPFAKNGICAFIATVGSGKTYNYLKMVAIQENLFDEPYFETVAICSTSGEFDKTVQTFRAAIKKSKLISIKDEELLTWLDGYKPKILLYNTLRKFIKNDFKDPDEQMKTIIKENRLHTDPNRLLKFLSVKLSEIGFRTYPHRLLLILDDYHAHPLLKKKDSPLSRELKKLRHFNINVIISVQTVKSIPKDIKRTLSDLVLFPGISEYDFKDLIRESTASCFDFKVLWENYRKIKCQRTMMKIHIAARRIIITHPD